ncbi:MAG: LptE family protein [Bacteroidota bacterium]
MKHLIQNKSKLMQVSRLFKSVLLVLGLLLLSCKPHVSLNGASIPIEAKTVSVGFFANNTSLGAPSLSQRFTEKLRDVVSQQTSLALMKANGDLQFEGYIASYDVAPIAIQSTDQASMNRLTISVYVKYSNKFEASKNFEQSFSRFADFKSSENISAKEPELVQEIYRQLTEDIFNKAFNNW